MGIGTLGLRWAYLEAFHLGKESITIVDEMPEPLFSEHEILGKVSEIEIGDHETIDKFDDLQETAEITELEDSEIML